MQRAIGCLWVTAVALGATACAHDLEGEEPPERSLYFPIGLTATANQRQLLVVNSNFDQRYNAGWLAVVSLPDLFDELAEVSCLGACDPGAECVAGSAGFACLTERDEEDCPGPCGDHEICVEDGSTIDCRGRPDFSSAIFQQLMIPSLGGKIALDPDNEIGVITARGEQPLTVVELGEGCEEHHAEGCFVHCGDPDDEEGLTSAWQRTECDREHLTKLEGADERTDEQKADEFDAENPDAVPPNKVNQAFVAEDRTFDLEVEDRLAISESEIADPFGIHVFERPGRSSPRVAIGYLGGTSPTGAIGRGFISILEVRAGHILKHERLLGPFAAFIGEITTYPAATDRPYLAATSHLGGVTQDERLLDWSSVYDIDLERAFAEEPDYFRVHQVGFNFGGYELADLAFSPDGGRAYAANRDPDSIVILDTELESRVEYDPETSTFAETEVPRYLPIAAKSVPGEPSGLVYIDRASGADLLAVTAFTEDTLFLLSVAGDTLRVDRRIDRVGQGPYDLIHVRRSGRELLLITAFFDHAVAIVDVTAADPQRFALLGYLRNPESVSSADRAR